MNALMMLISFFAFSLALPQVFASEPYDSELMALIYSGEDTPERVRELLMPGKADPNTVDENRWTLLHEAALNGHFTTLELLIDSGANLEARALGNQTPLFVASTPEKIKLLVKRGADVHARNGGGNALHYRAWRVYHGNMGRIDKIEKEKEDNLMLMRALIKCGVPSDRRDGNCRTPLDILEMEDREIASEMNTFIHEMNVARQGMLAMIPPIRLRNLNTSLLISLDKEKGISRNVFSFLIPPTQSDINQQ